MSKRNPDYENSFWQKFAMWCKGDYDPAKGKYEIKKPGQKSKGPNIIGKLMHILAQEESIYASERDKNLKTFKRLYIIVSVALGVLLTILLLVTVSQLPRFGDANAPENNEVARRYIEKGLEETGAVNIVAGMILDYRAFDTFGESCVLFVASCCVLMLLKEKKPEPEKRYDPVNSAILQPAARILVPIIIIFGIYVILNGHISPGGGFSGGAIIGTGFILYQTAFGFERTGKFLSEKFIKVITVLALSFYCFAKSYSFYTGANHLHSVITPGTPGAILSAGLIVYLNICVGIVVACTMYSFYAAFRRGSF